MSGVRGLYQKRGWFYYQPPTCKASASRSKPIALRTKDLVEAISLVEAERNESAMERAVISGTLKEVLPKYYHAKREDSKKTRRARRVVLTQFQEMTGNPLASEINQDMVEHWRSELMERVNPKNGKELSGSTVQTYTIILRAFVNWLMQERVLRVDPMSRLKKHTRVVATRRQHFLGVKDRDRLLDDDESPLYLKMVLHFGFLAGMRYSEMLAMTPAWIWVSEDWRTGSVTVQNTPLTMEDGSSFVWRPKTRHMRTVPLHPKVLSFLAANGIGDPFVIAPENVFWPADNKQSYRIDMKKSLASLAKRCELPKLNFHMMRRTFATHLAMKGVPLARIAGLIGDSLEVTEKHYAGFCPNHGNVLEVL